MKLKATRKLIFKLNHTLKETSFDEEVEIKRVSVFNALYLGRIENDSKEFEHVELIYRPESIDELKYLYHIKILGPGLKYEHLAYARVTWIQHIQILFVNRFMKFITNFENIFKILTILSFTIPIFMNSETNVNVYVSSPSEDIVVTDTLYNKSSSKDTSELIKDTIPIKTK